MRLVSLWKRFQLLCPLVGFLAMNVDGSAHTAPGIIASQIAPDVAVSTLHAPRNPKQTHGTDIRLDEVKREKGRRGTKVTYRIKTSGFPRDKTFEMRISSSAEPGPITWLTGVHADDSGSLASAVGPAGSPVDVSKLTSQIEDYNKGEFLMLEIVNDDGSVYAADRIYPFPVEAKEGSCHLWAELLSKDRKHFAIFGSGFGPNTDVKTTTSEDGGTDLKEVTTRVGPNDVLVADVRHRKGGGRAAFAATGQHCQVTLQYEFGRQAKGPQ
jgi:hypothetical protein